MSNKICSNCEYWEYTGQYSDSHMGECRRKAPVGIAFTGNFATIEGGKVIRTTVNIWPLTYCSEWCGEFSKMEEGG